LQIVLASNNHKKLDELQALLMPLGLKLTTQQSLGIAEVDEPHTTFIENALAKARYAAHHAGGPAIADDSGLCVEALGGAPGVISSHFAPLPTAAIGREAQRALQDTANNALLLDRLQGASNRRARFVSTLVAVRSANDPEPLVAVGRWFGEVLLTPQGAGGFGYDPLMFIPALGRAVAELEPQVKNTHSHRALACTLMLNLMREAWALG
jgi:XTP/dITP diphosphohydrolase